MFSMGFACISSDAIDFLPSTRVRSGSGFLGKHDRFMSLFAGSVTIHFRNLT